MTAVEELVDERLGDEPEERYATPIGPPTALSPGVVRLTRYIPYVPRPKQKLFLMLRCREAFYGGAAGGGKSDALLMGALQFVDVPNYAAIILRKTTTDLKLQGALIPRSHLWLDDTDARWSAQDKVWWFPSGATLTFSYCETDADVMRYRSAEFQFIGIDETTQWSEFAYRYLFSRLRGPDVALAGLQPSVQDGHTTLADVPLRMRSGSNPGDVGHAWCKRRLVDKLTRVCPFIPSKARDLEGIVNVEDYMRSLRMLDPVNWMRLATGDWEVRDPGEIFDVTNIEPVQHPFPNDRRRYERVRYWDMAATEQKAGNDPDWTVGFKLALDRQTGKWCIEHVVRTRDEPDKVEDVMRQTARADGETTDIVIEQEPGSEGKAFISYMRRHVLRGFHVTGDPAGSKDPKPVRIRMLAPVVNGGDCSIVLGPWTQSVLDEVDAWPNVTHDDQLDAFAGAQRKLSSPRARLRV